MSRLIPSFDIREAAERSAELDRRLSEFFKTEMPKPWPTLKAPVPTERPRARHTNLFRSRFALAASILFLLACSWFLANTFHGTTSPQTLGQGWRLEATRRPLSKTTPESRPLPDRGGSTKTR